MANAFDFELSADDKASAAIIRIEDAIRKLNPQLDKTREGLKLGGNDSTDSVSKINKVIDGLGRSAKDSVQHIGDIVPPLKMVGELAGKYSGMALKFGAVGAAAYGIGKAVTAAAAGLRHAAEGANRLDVAAKNAGMRVDDFSRLSGAMQIVGADAQSANAAVEGMFKTFNDALKGENDGALAVLNYLGVQIEKTKNGTADVAKTFENLARAFPTLAPENQKKAADMLGLDENTLTLLRKASEYKELLAKSDRFGLTMDPSLNDQLTEANAAMNELSSAWDGFKQKVANTFWKALLSDGSVKDGIEGISDFLSNGDTIGFNHMLGITRSDSAKKLREISGDQGFYNSLSWDEQGSVNVGYLTDNVKNKYEQWKRPVNAAVRLQQDMYAATNPRYAPGTNQNEQAYLSRLEAQYKLPSGVLDNVYNAESSRGRFLFSPAGAQGPFQFMPSTGRDYGLNTQADRMDFKKSSEAAAKYFRDLLKMFDGDVQKAVASYNWGQGNVSKYGLTRAPKETRDYLGKVMPGLPLNHPVDGDGGGTFNRESLFDGSGPVSEISQQVESGIRAGMADSKTQVEITLINQNSGERRVVTGSGGKVATALPW
ncbi:MULTISPECIES: transglycosylase SLT domain-containing protein [Brenneria]|uniref:Lytic transglycosylase domain-containing protein n=1 Tax=Brenneria nigrifluens DSM 30175 = ATCC 13028 TaxID=1121120 RepID=A0A2U1UBM6_9GAMM|nr:MULTISPECIES: lytic transglycosylase domain-containing protein [Brenneria]EHD21325.1 Lytic transglycosylase catalytic [Brenneria sp. EniD312]PWC19063.1 lytic transglycosylase domain-containing protein [Brenneria nigrifluens DSM 30175 = ATCC 13028]QCR04459.1 lytic transglycosylase domain-containing protein [Brenneria nigrifluens DSM 30175 = ATCC 13028]